MKLEAVNTHERDPFILFDEETHTYHWNNIRFTSVTTWINSFFPKFDMNLTIKKMMSSPKWKYNPLYGKTCNEIIEIWTTNNLHAVQEGTKLHRDIELFYNDIQIDNKSLEYSYFRNFVKDHYYLIPFRTEWKIFIEEFQTAGTIDMVFKKTNGKLDIYDWKRCKQIKTTNFFKKFASAEFLQHIPDTNYMHYCLQLNIYKYILEKKYNYMVDQMFLVCLHPENKNKNYLLYQVPHLKKEIDLIFNYIQTTLQKPSESDTT
jgi:hypothetical protein